ncbi:MAG TPA: hypothetical protein VLH08_04170 [Acidobacteriota bacterium]|nr:hypothetical protein [Acidobacteriota bacterium]
MRSVYRIRIIPNSLIVEGTPSVLIADGRGRNSVLNGKPLRIQTISGDSTQIQDPASPVFRKPQKPIPLWIPSTMIAVLLGLWFYLRFRRKREGTPRAQLLRQLRRLRQELQNGEVRNPLLLSRLLRSDLIWGFPADSFTPAELKEKSSGILETISAALESLDLARYAPESEKVEAKNIEDAVVAAIQIVNIRRVDQINGGRAA